MDAHQATCKMGRLKLLPELHSKGSAHRLRLLQNYGSEDFEGYPPYRGHPVHASNDSEDRACTDTRGSTAVLACWDETTATVMQDLGLEWFSNLTEVPRSEVYKVDRSSTGSVVKPTWRKTSQCLNLARSPKTWQAGR